MIPVGYYGGRFPLSGFSAFGAANTANRASPGMQFSPAIQSYQSGTNPNMLPGSPEIGQRPMSQPAIPQLKQVSRIRNEFPEAWIWTEVSAGYLLSIPSATICTATGRIRGTTKAFSALTWRPHCYLCVLLLIKNFG